MAAFLSLWGEDHAHSRGLVPTHQPRTSDNDQSLTLSGHRAGWSSGRGIIPGMEQGCQSIYGDEGGRSGMEKLGIVIVMETVTEPPTNGTKGSGNKCGPFILEGWPGFPLSFPLSPSRWQCSRGRRAIREAAPGEPLPPPARPGQGQSPGSGLC